MKSLSRTRSVGGSLIITIPSEIVKEKAIKEGELVEVNIEKIKKDGFGLHKDIGHFTKEDELDTEL